MGMQNDTYSMPLIIRRRTKLVEKPKIRNGYLTWYLGYNWAQLAWARIGPTFLYYN